MVLKTRPNEMTLRAHISVQRTVIGTLNECSLFKGCELIEKKQ